VLRQPGRIGILRRCGFADSSFSRRRHRSWLRRPFDRPRRPDGRFSIVAQRSTTARSPGGLKGTAVLAFGRPRHAGDQWLYRPERHALKQVTAPVSAEPFVGSDLSLHDLELPDEMASWTEMDARATLRGEESDRRHGIHPAGVGTRRALIKGTLLISASVVPMPRSLVPSR
jgi:hypothetical protein